MDDLTHEIKLSPDVINSIVAISIQEAESIYISKSFNDKVRLKNKLISTEIVDNNAFINIHAIVDYGVNIPEVTRKAQSSIVDTILMMTGIKVSSIDVYIEGIKTNF